MESTTYAIIYLFNHYMQYGYLKCLMKILEKFVQV